jgi:tRNA (adenine37-N6)-methyltransferase
MMNFSLKPIGTIHSPFREATGTPIQSATANGVEGWVEVLPEFAPGLQDLDGFSRIWLLYLFHMTTPARLLITPFLDQQERGVFATRSPCRPNSIGLSCVRLMCVNGTRLRIADLDILDETPLLDIKPYVPAFDCFESRRIGWLEGKATQAIMADNRFEPTGHKLKQC